MSCRRARKNKIEQSFIAQRPPSPQRSSFGRPRPTPIPLPDHPTVDSGKIKLYKVLLRSAPSRISPSPDNFPATTTLPLPHPNPRGGSVAPPPPPAHSTTPIPASRAARRRPRLLPRPFSSSRAGRSGCHQGSCPPRYAWSIRVDVQVARRPLEVATASYASLGPPLSPRSTPLLSSSNSNRQGGVQKTTGVAFLARQRAIPAFTPNANLHTANVALA